MASGFILIAACTMPFVAYTHASYFIIRSGGNTLITVLFDSIYTWAIAVTAAYVMSRYTTLSVTWMLAVIDGLEVIKCLISFVLVRSGMWVKNIVKN
jgi:Na+-driven multidrug efflux pump